ncbi:MAG: bifunctional nuclease family protein [Bacteroidales bacterium]|nr:bifunctional nuclease family protein [Bacteroidales bacterium]
MSVVELEIADIKSSKQGDAFVLVLKEKRGERLFPVIIGLSEARAIALQFNSIKPLRPSTHDLFDAFAKKCGFKVRNVEIVNYASGIFYATVFMANDEGEVLELDSRTSDAVTLALKNNAPVNISPDLLDRVCKALENGELHDDNKGQQYLDFSEVETEQPPQSEEPLGVEDDKYVLQKLGEMSMDELQNLLDGAIECEEYEMASKIKEEIERRKS